MIHQVCKFINTCRCLCHICYFYCGWLADLNVFVGVSTSFVIRNQIYNACLTLNGMACKLARRQKNLSGLTQSKSVTVTHGRFVKMTVSLIRAFAVLSF